MQGWVALCVGIVGAACGRVGFDPLGGADGGDGGTPDTANVTCTPWGTPTLLPALSTASDDWEPALSPDRTTLVFAEGSAALYSATRMDQTFTNVTLIASLDFPGEEDIGPAWGPTGTELYFSSDRVVNGEFRLWRSTFDGNAFAPPTQVAEFVTTTGVASPTIRSDNLEMYFGTIVTADYQIMRAVRATPGDPWMLDGIQSQLTMGGVAGWPSLSYDGLTLYYEYKNGTTADIYVATRTSRSELFDSPTIVSELANGVNGDPELSRDGTELYLSSDPATTDTRFDIYVSRRTCTGGNQ